MTQSKPPCTVEGCDRVSLTWKSGLCSRHYQRAKSHNGDPLGGRSAVGAAAAYYDANLLTVTADCKLWPFATFTSGTATYGKLWVEGKWQGVHVLACAAFHGPRPGKLDAAHNCGVPLCWNGPHLRWDTRKGNMADQLVHGTRNIGERNGRAKLTEAQAREIKTRYLAGETADALAASFSVARNHVQAIAAGTKWKYLDGPKR